MKQPENTWRTDLEVQYRQLFLKDLKKLKKQSVYQQIVELAFEILSNTEDLRSLSNVKAS